MMERELDPEEPLAHDSWGGGLLGLLVILLLLIVSLFVFVRIVGPARQGAALLFLRLEKALSVRLPLSGPLLGLDVHLDADCLSRAIEKGDRDAAFLLLHAGLDPNTPDTENRLPLERAAGKGQEEVVRILLVKGAQIDAVSPRGETALTALAASGNDGLLQLLLSLNASVNMPDSLGRTPLMRAVANDHLSTVELLLKSGANPDIEDSEGETAVTLAKKEDKEQLLSAMESYSQVLIEEKRALTLKFVKELTGEEGPSTPQESRKDILERALQAKPSVLPGKVVEAPGEPTPTPSDSNFERSGNPMRYTRLRVVGDTRGHFKVKRGQLKLIKIEADIKNFGEVSAEDIVVRVRVPSGKYVELEGPRNLDPKVTALFSLDLEDETVLNRRELKTDPTCSNCYK